MPTPKTKQPATIPAPISPRPNLDSFQLMLTDLFTELVTHGDSDSADVENLLYALYSAQQGRYFGESEDAHKRWKEKAKWDWLRKFKNARRALPTIEMQKNSQTSLTEEIRANTRDALVSEMRSFLKTANPEEIDFLNEILNSWSSSSLTRDGKPGELYIANAFHWVLSRPGWYFSVPEWAKEAVEEHLKWLTEQREKLLGIAA